MAVIGKIQKNSYLLLIVIGLAMLAFIFTDNFKNLSGGEEPLARGTLFGQPINENELSDLEDDFVTRDRQNAAYQGKEYTSTDEDNSRDQAFNEIIRKQVMQKELDLLQLQVSSDELNDMISGNNIHPWVSQISMFKNSIGEYSRDSVVKFLDNLYQEPDGIDTALYSRWKEARKQWSTFEQELKGARTTDKYVSLVKKGIYVNSLESKNQYVANKETRGISFVLHKYGAIQESEVDFSDDDIRAYYDLHKGDREYEQTVEAAEISFVEFPVKYSQADLNNLTAEMEEMKAAFKLTDNTIYFMATKGEDKFYSDTTGFELGEEIFELNPQGQVYKYPASIDSLVQASNKGDVIGPFKSVNPETNEDMLIIAKVNGFEMQKRAWVRHILVGTSTRTEAEAKKKSDSIINVIKSKNNFVEMVELFSEDPGSKTKGGEYKWFKEGQMVPEFNDASFEGPMGKLQLVKTDYGYHIVEVLGREERKLPKLAPIRKTIKPGQETIDDMENIAYDFINNVEDLNEDSAFYKAALEKGLMTKYSKLYIASNFVTGFEETSQIKKFSFAKDASEGDISEAILDNGVIKVAYLENKIGEGVPNYDDVKDQMRIPALREKQAKKYMEVMGGTSNLNEVATKVNGKVQSATLKFSSNAVPGAGGNEGEIVGMIFSLTKENEGAVLVPIKGEAGIYVITLDKINEAEESDDYVIEGTALLNTRTGSADGNVMRALREKANVEDNRQRIEAQGR